MTTRQYILTRSLSFDSAHALPTLPAEHPCHALHGHSFTAQITVAADHLDEQAMVLDLSMLAELQKTLDRRCLNDLMPHPTLEACAQYIWDWLDSKLWALLGADDRGDVTILQVRVAENERGQVDLVLGGHLRT